LILNPISLLLLAALLVAAAMLHSPWWLIALPPLAAWVGFDRWARGGAAATFVNPATGRELTEFDLGKARVKRYAIADFFSAAVQGDRGCLVGTYDDLPAILAGCAGPKGLPSFDPDKVNVFILMSCCCASCGQPFASRLTERFFANTLQVTPPSLGPGALPDAKGCCPACSSRRLRYINDPSNEPIEHEHKIAGPAV
jgi:hypothetical protein